MLVVIPFVVNSALNFVLGLLIALIFGPEQFGLYAIGAALMVFVNAAAMDWIRLAAARFYTGAGSEEARAFKLSLDGMVACVSIALSGLLLAAVIAGVDVRLPTMLVAAALAAGVSAGLFDYTGTVLRARRKDHAYARFIIVKNVAALLLMLGGAWLTQSAAVVLVGVCLSVGAALISIRADLDRDPLALGAMRLAHVRRFAAYAFPLVGANILMALVPLLNRSLMAGQHGFAEAGYFALAADMGVKLFGATGAALEILLLREVVRIDETEGREAAHRRIGRNMTIVLMAALPVALGLYAVLPAFEAAIIPPAYRGHFASYFAIVLPGFLLFALNAAAINPVFMIGHRTLIASLAAAAGLAANAVILLLAIRNGASPLLYAVGVSAAFGTVFLVGAVLAFREKAVRPAWRELLIVVLAALAMTATIWPLRGLADARLALSLMLPAGAVVYGAIILAFDVAGIRNALLKRLKRPGGRA